LIKDFKDITGVPVIFNTSFNLAGDPLVETIEDAFDAMMRSKLKYLFLPELGLLATKTIEDPQPKEVIEVAEELVE
jgi:carbamoyltransferase